MGGGVPLLTRHHQVAVAVAAAARYSVVALPTVSPLISRHLTGGQMLPHSPPWRGVVCSRFASTRKGSASRGTFFLFTSINFQGKVDMRKLPLLIQSPMVGVLNINEFLVKIALFLQKKKKKKLLTFSTYIYI